jgi:hypothetical protein
MDKNGVIFGHTLGVLCVFLYSIIFAIRAKYKESTAKGIMTKFDKGSFTYYVTLYSGLFGPPLPPS